MPVGLGVMFVAVSFPGGDFRDQLWFVGDAAIQALGRQDGEFGFGHVEPASVFGRVTPLEALNQPTCLLGRKGFVERCWFMGIEIVLHENDLRRIGIVPVRQFLEICA